VPPGVTLVCLALVASCFSPFIWLYTMRAWSSATIRSDSCLKMRVLCRRTSRNLYASAWEFRPHRSAALTQPPSQLRGDSESFSATSLDLWLRVLNPRLGLWTGDLPSFPQGNPVPLTRRIDGNGVPVLSHLAYRPCNLLYHYPTFGGPDNFKRLCATNPDLPNIPWEQFLPVTVHAAWQAFLRESRAVIVSYRKVDELIADFTSACVSELSPPRKR
jgi:hypothetical protein